MNNIGQVDSERCPSSWFDTTTSNMEVFTYTAINLPIADIWRLAARGSAEKPCLSVVDSLGLSTPLAPLLSSPGANGGIS